MQQIDFCDVRLRPLSTFYAKELFSVLSDPAIYEFENSAPLSETALRERYKRLELGAPQDVGEKWLNWMVANRDDELMGYVQATVYPDGLACIAYEFNSRYWRQGFGSTSVRAMMSELAKNYGVLAYVAVLKRANFRSERLLRKFGFRNASSELKRRFLDEDDETVLTKKALKLD